MFLFNNFYVLHTKGDSRINDYVESIDSLGILGSEPKQIGKGY